MDNSSSTSRKNPSRATCEGIIKRILMTEVLENGGNKHFKNAADFMNYFQSLYPASDALTKQVQRAVKNLNMPKDDNGFYIPNKTSEDVSKEKELEYVFSKASASVVTLEEYQPLLLKADPEIAPYLLKVIQNSQTFDGKFVTASIASNGILFYTKAPKQLEILINSLIVR